jgi:pilus assembly protein CpaB
MFAGERFFVRKLSRRAKSFAVLAIALGGLAFQLVRGYAAELEALRPIAGDPVTVVVATSDVARGTVLAEGDVATTRIPSRYAPPGAITSIERAVGLAIVGDLAAGEPITATRLAVASGPVASIVPSGLRAFPIRANVPADAVRAGDRVDVLATYGGPHPYSDTVAAGLEVLSIERADDAAVSADGQGTVSLLLLVSPETAERLAYATAYADLAVSVAPTDDT